MKPLSEYPTPETSEASIPAHQATRFHYGEDPLVDADVAKNMEQRLAACRDILACINSSQCLSDELHTEIRETLAATKP